MRKGLSIALMAAALGASNQAAAQGMPARADEWIAPTISGCKIILNAGAFDYELDSLVAQARWSGGCDASGLANGDGELTFLFRDDGSDLKADYHGRIIDGLMTGAWKFATWERRGGDYMGSGIYNYLTFSDGCMTTFEKQVVRSVCSPARGRQVQAGLTAARSPSPGTAIAPRAATTGISGARAGALDANRSKLIAGNGRSAMDCVGLVNATPGDTSLGLGRRFIKNSCSGPVEITWCYADGDNECARGSGGGMWTLGAGRAWPINPEREIRWAACHGANTVSFEKGSAGLRFICMAPK